MTCSKLWLCRYFSCEWCQLVSVGWRVLANEHAQLRGLEDTWPGTALSLQSNDTPGEGSAESRNLHTSLDSGMGILQGTLEGRAQPPSSAAATCPQGLA